MIDYQHSVSVLIGLASEAIEAENRGETVLFVERTEHYLSELNTWQQSINKNNPLREDRDDAIPESDRNALRSSIEELSRVHKKLMDVAGLQKNEVGEKITDLNKKSVGLKKYNDQRLPRGNIAKKHKG